jgi:hypothetical protein
MSLKRALASVPAALFSTACVSRAWTPAVSMSYWAQDVPPPTEVTLPNYREAATRWQLPPSNPWARWQKMTLLSSLDPTTHNAAEVPDVQGLDVVAEAQSAATRFGAEGLPADTIWFVDLRGAASVAFGAALSRASKEPVAAITTFNNWPASNELIPAEETLAALVTLQPRLPGPEDRVTHPVVLLDAWRLAYRDDEPADDVTDNRYMLAPSDLPDPESLRENGITRVVYVVEDLDAVATEEDDLHEAFMAYQAAGIAIFMIDLSFASRELRQDVVLREALAPHYYVVAPRVTVCSDIRFYARARGGFGGVHGFPTGGRGGFHGFGG